ncbi:MAG TPA: hypothetical protein VII06_24080 [Chloroflexota bacterium]
MRATVTASYPTLLMGFVGVRSLDLQCQTVVSILGSGGPLPPAIAPIALCQSVSAAMDVNPTVPQTVWALKQNPCGVTNWDGLIAIGGIDDCKNYPKLLQPAPSASPPPIGTAVILSSANCPNVDRMMSPYAGTPVWIAIVATNAATSMGSVLCYRQVQFTVSSNLVTGIPTGEPPICGGVRETY